MNLLLYGAEINSYFEKQFRLAQASVREMLSREHEEAEKEIEKEKRKLLEKVPEKKTQSSEFRTGAAFLKDSVGSDVMLRVKRRESLYTQESGWYRGYASSL